MCIVTVGHLGDFNVPSSAEGDVSEVDSTLVRSCRLTHPYNIGLAPYFSTDQ